jgi:hypothetical protein
MVRRPQRLKPRQIWDLYAALKGRSSTVVQAFEGFAAAKAAIDLPEYGTTEVVPFPSRALPAVGELLFAAASRGLSKLGLRGGSNF